MALVTYESQIAFLKPLIKNGTMTQSGTWSQYMTWGKMWHGVLGGYSITFKTIGEGPYMMAGSFRINCMCEKQFGELQYG